MALLKNQTQINELRGAPWKIEEIPKEILIEGEKTFLSKNDGTLIELIRRPIEIVPKNEE